MNNNRLSSDLDTDELLAIISESLANGNEDMACEATLMLSIRIAQDNIDRQDLGYKG